MAKLILFAGVVYALVWLLRRGVDGPQDHLLRRGRNRRADGQADAAELVRCAQCGVHLPRSEARVAAGRIYCSAEHARLGPKAN